MAKLFHPTLPDVTCEVDDELVERHLAVGWRKGETKAVKEARDVSEPAE